MMMKLEPIITIININYIHHLLDVFIVSSLFVSHLSWWWWLQVVLVGGSPAPSSSLTLVEWRLPVAGSGSPPVTIVASSSSWRSVTWFTPWTSSTSTWWFVRGFTPCTSYTWWSVTGFASTAPSRWGFITGFASTRRFVTWFTASIFSKWQKVLRDTYV